ncbi:MAG: hypothetical protein ACRDJY_09320 [Thermoleophilaceae bacterium]
MHGMRGIGFGGRTMKLDLRRRAPQRRRSGGVVVAAELPTPLKATTNEAV